MEIKLNERQLEAVEAVNGAVLVFAGAGSGKTRVLTSRIAHMVNDCRISPDHILAITFTNKAANEMRERLELMLDHLGYMQISTIHSMCARILRYEASHLPDFSADFTIYSETESEKILKQVLTQYKDEISEKINFMHHISKAKNEALAERGYAAKYLTGKDAQIICEVMTKYNAELKKNNAMDFDDLLLKTYHLFRDDPEVLGKYTERYRYISIDEFQDTNHVQYLIFKLLAQKYRNLFVVGDDDQSIYSWRGADVRNILDFKKDFPEAKIVKLEQNYRSTQKILDVANTIIDKNPDRMEKALWTDNKGGVKVETYIAQSESDEAFYVISQIAALMRYHNYDFKDFAILMRLNAMSRTFEQECRNFNVPHRIYGGFKFYDRKEIKDIHAYLRLIVNRRDNEAFYRIVNFPRRGIGDTTVQKLRVLSESRNVPCLDILANLEFIDEFNSGVKNKLSSFYRLIEELTNLSKEQKLYAFVSGMCETLNLRALFQEEGEEDRSMYLNEFLASIADYSKNNIDAVLVNYLNDISLASDRGEGDDNNEITLGTIHAVKGLEFKVVFVVGLENDIFPISRAHFDLQQLNEERRLMYVAVTRAMQRLYVTRARTRFLYGQRQEQAPSPFFKEVDMAVRNIEDSNPPFSVAGSAFANHETRQVKNPVQHSLPFNDGSKKAAHYEVGSKVIHKSFGKGIVMSTKGDIAEIVFENAGIKVLDLRFAPLSADN